jgi:hypothetical protein
MSTHDIGLKRKQHLEKESLQNQLRSMNAKLSELKRKMVDFATLASRLQSNCYMSFDPLSSEKDA